ncbi:putative transferase CAF17, mitochondrial [Chaetomium strumarium]|uniref:Iron-sulfur cluster assembly factor IBA57 homolog, mitochondrial n=1 Tax=Chaetomium strumarium TaxID=1170767 RepID=A0AAJ0LY19_9PEZI|nr:putative transferase CAF17, mitochondrial [Chaetomium strumarium]
MQPARTVFNSAGTFTCRGCLSRLARQHQQRRTFSGSVPRHAAPARPSPAGLAQLSSRRLISVSGPDAAKYLQGVITANLFPGPAGPNPSPLRSDAGFYAAFLTAQGRVLHDVFVYRDVRDTSHPPGHSWLLEVDAAEADRLQKHIRRYKLRAKFDVRLLDDGEGQVWQAWDDNLPASSSSSASSSFSLLCNLGSSGSSGSTIITLPDTRAPNLGYRILTFSPTTPDSLPFHDDISPVEEDAYTIRRYLHGIPEGQAEILREQALPHESNIDRMGAIDFRKGCYVGQELTIRTEHRGVVRKRILPCLLYPPEQDNEAGMLAYSPEIGTGLTAEMVPPEASIGRVGKKGRSAGKWLRGAGNLGLALCRLEIMTDIVLPGESGGVGYKEGDEFVVGLEQQQEGEGGGGGEERKVKIKAFVPEWLRNGLVNTENH